jgi:glutamine amidotransferase
MIRRVGLIDLGAQNLFSIRSALNEIGANVSVISSLRDWSPSVDQIVIPGVGAFALAMQYLQATGLEGRIRDHAHSGRPILGICLGAQLLMSRSFEFGEHRGLGLIEGDVDYLDRSLGCVPRIGWLPVSQSNVTVGCSSTPWFYFNHSLHMKPTDASSVVARVSWGDEAVVAATGSGTLIGLQFHPEKSGDDGLVVLRNVLSLF